MAKKYALLIAVEQYLDSKIKNVKYAEADARVLAAALEALGFKTELLINNRATFNIVRTQIQEVLKKAGKDDEVFIFFAGHGFARSGLNYIICHDTQVAHLKDGSMPLQDVFTQMKSSATSRAVLFLDCCESGLALSQEVRSIYTSMSQSEIEQFFKSSKGHVCFSSCRDDEESIASDDLGHGVWSHHLILALQGNAPAATVALGGQQLVTTMSLQNYLQVSVKETIKQKFTTYHEQTPWIAGSFSNEFIVADVTSNIAKKKAAVRAKLSLGQIKDIVFRRESAQSVRALSGYDSKRGHHIPKNADGFAISFLGKIARKEIEEEIDSKHRAIRTALSLKSKELTASYENNSGFLTTKFFDYSVTIWPNAENLDEAIWRYEIDNIKDPSVFSDESLNEIFDTGFNEVVLTAEKKKDIKLLVEELEESDIVPDFDSGYTYCSLTIPESNIEVRFESNQMRIIHPTKTDIPKLLDALRISQQSILSAQIKQYLPLPKTED